MFCPQCGSNNEDGSRFCYSCGRQLSDGTSGANAGNQGPAWRSFGNPTPTQPAIPAPVPDKVPAQPVYQPPTPPPQIIIGIPREDSSSGMWILGLAMMVLIGAVAFAVIRVADVDTSSWPLVGAKKDSGGGEVVASKPEGILVSLSAPCKDKSGQPCNIIWDVTGFKQSGDNTAIDYEVKATGTAGCQVDVASDQKTSEAQLAAGKPGPFLEGARGRYYPLTKSSGFASNGGTLSCDKTQKGTWTFAPTPGETALKLRHPNVPPARIDTNPLAAKPLPPADPLAVIPLPAGGCATSQNQPCRGAWEIGPYGTQSDKSEILFFNVRYEGPPGCTINWAPDLTTHQAIVAKGQKGIHLEVPGQPDLGMISGGGVASENRPQPCGQILSGFWRFAPGTIAPTISFFYPDFPPVQVPIRP